MEILQATKNDVPGITTIYNQAILETTATFDTEPKTLDDRLKWFHIHQPQLKFPVLVAKEDSEVRGWACIGPWSDRCAYEDTGEITIYVSPSHQGKGIGKQLMRTLLAQAKTQNYYTLIARIAGESDASVRLHEFFGFKKIGTMERVGYKFGRRIDVTLYQLFLDDFTLPSQ